MDSIKLTQAPATLKRLGHELAGTLHLMRHHMVFKAANREIWICYPMISELCRANSSIRMVGKDFMFLAFEFDNERKCRLVMDTIEQLRQVRVIDELYAFVYSPASQEKTFNGWTIYDAVREYQRMGAINADEVGDHLGKWRVSRANAEHQLCRTYPRTLVVPQGISDNVLAYAAKYRSKSRLPVLSYYLRLNQCTISRCSQPLVGIKQSRSMQDEAVIAAIWQSTEGPRDRHGAQTDNLVVDLRPSTNAIAQVALGGGTENMDRYRPARKVYLGVDNLHVMRDSLQRVTDALRHSDVSDEPPNPTALDRSQWLKHVAVILESSRSVVEQVYIKCSHVVVHCSDGWDRTPQITSLAMIGLDPYYRTLEGFMVLVEKEWVSFGHQFALRANLVNSKCSSGSASNGLDSEAEETDLFTNVTNFLTETAKGSQVGPIFAQFLDTVYQLLTLWPQKFEFSERFLRRLVYHSYSAQYGTFLFNCERDLLANEAPQRTRSVWDYFLARRAQFINPHYERAADDSNDVLILPNDWKPRWWAGVFGRIDKDMNDPNAWRQPLSRKHGLDSTTTEKSISKTPKEIPDPQSAPESPHHSTFLRPNTDSSSASSTDLTNGERTHGEGPTPVEPPSSAVQGLAVS